MSSILSFIFKPKIRLLIEMGDKWSIADIVTPLPLANVHGKLKTIDYIEQTIDIQCKNPVYRNFLSICIGNLE